MRVFILVLLFIAVPLAQGTFHPGSEADFWRTTQLDSSVLRSFLSNSTCYKSESLLQSCKEAVALAGSILHSSIFDSAKQASLEDRVADFDRLLIQMESLINRNTAIRHRSSPSAMIYGSIINEQLRHFDPHAQIVPLRYLEATLGPQERRSSLGIGADMELNGNGVVVRRVYDGTPAQEAGLKVNDRILSVNGDRVLRGMKAMKALRLLDVNAGRSVRLSIQRGGLQLPISVTVKSVMIPDVLPIERVDLGTNPIGLLQIRRFSDGVCEQVRAEIASFAENNVRRGIGLDLRGNPGGEVSEAACVMSLFSDATEFVIQKQVERLIPHEFSLIDHAEVFSEWSGSGKWKDHLYKRSPFSNLPLVVIVNAFTASAAEMLAAALQDKNRAWLVGETTFGKGVTQAVVRESLSPNIRLLYTISQYFRPSGAAIHAIGVSPDFSKPFERLAWEGDRVFPRELEQFGETKGLTGQGEAKWTISEKRTIEKRSVAVCTRHQGHSQNFWLWQKQTFGFEDNQKSFALAVLACELQGSGT